MAKTCKLTRTRKVSVCGSQDHSTPLDKKSFTNRKTDVPEEKCRSIHRSKEIWKNNKRTPIKLNEETHIALYTSGTHYGSKAWDGYQVKCRGRNNHG